MMERSVSPAGLDMVSLHSTAAAALRAVLDSQPTSAAKMTFMWNMAAGPAMARAARVIWRDGGVLVIRAESDSWRKEIRRARPILADRLRQLAGDAIKKIEIV